MTLSTASKSSHFDVVIIGGGINGIGLLRDLSLHGVSALLIDRGAFAKETSSASSKMLHGGIRYLESFDFELVFEALREKNTWLDLLPQYAKRAKYHIPIYPHSSHNYAMTACGSLLYGLLASGQDPLYLPWGKQRTMQLFPQLRSDGLQGCVRYEDAYVDDYALAMANLQDALSHAPHNQAWEFCELQSLEEVAQRNYQLKVQYQDQCHQISASFVVFCTGPFTDALMHKLSIPWRDCLRLSRGSHLWLPASALQLSHPLVMQDKAGRVIFLMPRGDRILLGTTECPLQGKDVDLEKSITQEEEDYLLHWLHFYFPQCSISKKEELSSFAGVRPLAVPRHQVGTTSSQNLNAGQVSRHHQVFEPLSNLFVLVGGKYTTFRVMVQDIAKVICARREVPYSTSTTKQPLQLNGRNF